MCVRDYGRHFSVNFVLVDIADDIYYSFKFKHIDLQNVKLCAIRQILSRLRV